MSGLPYLQQEGLHTKAPHRAALLTQPGNFKQALKDASTDPKKTLFGVGSGIASPFVTKLIAATKPDYIWLDVEHGVWDRLTLQDSIHATQHHSEGRTVAVVRAGKHDEALLVTALDAGASAIIIPHAESAEDVKKYMHQIYYPPLGGRSLSPWTYTPGVTDTSLYPDDPNNFETANRHIALIPQIESVKGLENVEEIAALEGVDALFFGPGDYSADAGLPFALNAQPRPELLEAMGKFAAAGRKYGKPLMGGVLGPEMIPMLIQLGFGMINITMDVWGFTNVINNGLKQAREMASQMDASSSAPSQ